jgi:two-component system sensor histidine kinase KdpD
LAISAVGVKRPADDEVSMTADRPDPDALLAKVTAHEQKQQRGKLKVFFGMAPGVGKTYAMLEAAHKVAKEGRDVIVGYVEPHARPETQALVLGLAVGVRPRSGARA